MKQLRDHLKALGSKSGIGKKTDTFSEVIWNVAPNNGNNAVLRGWAKPGGLRKLSKLKQVFLSIEENQKPELTPMLWTFVVRMKELCPGVKVLRTETTQNY
ncbi:hypothetical protein QC764_0062610 [Podospora pseudoanserina]|uniref:Uncharacterized protein n=1 Tax=Podospora pseudoanserina TaxID=2609844 RepID=A0ABR0I8Y0_9PEZI|nr:hypothetical protein QC764_0062610 [Podospora pseudoanserina]